MNESRKFKIFEDRVYVLIIPTFLIKLAKYLADGRHLGETVENEANKAKALWYCVLEQGFAAFALIDHLDLCCGSCPVHDSVFSSISGL